MGLDTPSRYQLIVESRKECEKHARTIQREVQKFTASTYSNGLDVAVADDPENYHFAYIASAAARNLIADPRAHLAWGEDDVEETVLDLEDGLNAWFIDTKYRDTREQFLVDMCLGFCVGAISQEPRVGYEAYDEDAIQTPRLRRIPQMMFGWDVQANHFNDCEYLFHVCIKKKQWMLDHCKPEEGWDIEAIRSMEEEFGVSDARTGKPSALKRGEVAYFEYWDRTDLDEDDPAWADIPQERREFYHGTIYTLAWGGDRESGKATDLRAARPYFGPECGPYIMGGFLTVPNQVAPLASLVANAMQINSVNRQARANQKAAESFKTMTLVDAPTQDGRWAVMSANNGDVLASPGLDPQRIATVTQGGVQPEAANREEFERQRADRAIGTSDELRGQANPNTKATNALIAQQASAGVNNLFDAKFADFEANGARAVLYMMVNDDRTVTRGKGTTYIHDDGVQRAQTQGFVQPDEVPPAQEQKAPFHFDDLDIRVESMRMDGSEENRFVQINNLLLQWTPLIAQGATQFADFAPLFKRAADVYRFPELRSIFNQEAAAQYAQKQQEAANAEPAAEPRTMPGPSAGPKVTASASGTPHVSSPKMAQGPQIKMAAAGGKK